MPTVNSQPEALIHGMGVQFVAPEPDWTQAFRQWKESRR